jgi:hypothetical protein
MHRLLVLLLLVASLACSSGGGGGGGDDDSKGAVSSIAGPGVTQGTITGFGSRVVGGTRWTIPGATIVMDGETNGFIEADLLQGMVVTIEGGRSEDATTGTATRVEYDDAIEGPIHEVSIVGPNTRRLTMLGAMGPTVLVRSDETLFFGTAFDTLFPSNVVEVSGIVDDDDEIEATLVVHLDDAPAVGVSGSPIELKGEVQNLTTNTNPKSFTLGFITVWYDGATDTSGVPGGLENGQRVEAKGVYFAPGFVGTDGTTCTVDDVCEIALVDDPLLEDMENVDLEGFVTASTNQNEFEVDGRSVDASGPSVNRDPTESNFIAVGARVAVEGNLVGGTLIAETVRNRSADVRIGGTLDQTSDRNVAAGTIELGTDTIRVDASTVMIDEQGPNENFDFGDIVAGDDLVVIGTNLNNSIRATHLTRKSP